MIHTAKRRLGTRSLMVVPMLALFGAIPTLGSGAVARADGPVEATGSRHAVLTQQGAELKQNKHVKRARGKITLDVDAPDAPILPGRTYSWPFTVTNEGPARVEAVTFSTPLSKRLEFVSGQDDCSWKQRMAVCPLGPIRHGETRTGVLTAKVADDACAGDTIGGSAAVTWGEAPATKRVETEFPQVKVARTADLSVVEKAPAQILPGGVLPYEITVLNKGAATAADVVLRQIVRAVLPADAVAREPVKVAQADAPCASRETGRETGFVCHLGPLESGESRRVKLNVLVNAKAAAGAVIKAPAQVTSPTIDADKADNDCAPETKVVSPLPVRAAIPARAPGDHMAPEGPAERPGGVPPEGPGAGTPPKGLMGLPHTGAPSRVLGGLALGLVGGGLVLMRLGRRRRKSI